MYVDQEYIDEARAQYAPPDHPVFQLVPPEFEQRAVDYFGDEGMPKVNRDNAWAIYLGLLAFLRTAEDWDVLSLSRRMEEEELEVLNLAPPRQAEQQLAVMAGQRGEVEVDCRDDLGQEDFVFEFDVFTNDEEAYATDN